MTLITLRNEIDSLDREIIELIGKRFVCVKSVAEYKKKNGFDALQKKRWEDVLQSRQMQARTLGIDESMITDIWNILHDYALIKEKEIIDNK